MKVLTVLSVAFVSVLTFPAKAATLTCTFQFTASGTIGTRSFTNASITLTTVGDTLNLAGNGGGDFSVANDSVTVSISGVGTFQFTLPANSAMTVGNMGFVAGDNPPGTPLSGIVIILFRITNGGFIELGNINNLTAPWDLTSSLGPISLYAVNVGWNSAPVNTNGGILNFYDGNGTYTFQATVTPTVAVAPAQLNLSYQLGGVLPVGVLQVSGLGSPASFTVSTSNWLSANPTSGTTPNVGTSPVTVNVSPSGLVAGPYSGTVSVTQNGATVIVPVNLTVTAPFTPSIYDVNGDGVVNVADVQLVINAALGIIH